MSSLSNEYYKRKLRQLVIDSRLFRQNFDDTFTSKDDDRISLRFERWFVVISNDKQVAYTCGNTFDYLLDTLDREILNTEERLDEI